MIINESFQRCEKCDSGWFEKKELFMIHKTSSYDNPIAEKKQIEYRCMECNHLQYMVEPSDI